MFLRRSSLAMEEDMAPVLVDALRCMVAPTSAAPESKFAPPWDTALLCDCVEVVCGGARRADLKKRGRDMSETQRMEGSLAAAASVGRGDPNDRRQRKSLLAASCARQQTGDARVESQPW